MLQRKRRTILILAANPKGTPRLSLGREIQFIRDQTERNRQLIVKDCPSVRPQDIQRVLLKFQPQIVHFCGHGQGDGLVFEDDFGEQRWVAVEAIEGLFELFRDQQVECVVLNACFSEGIAYAISQHIDYVIGMSQEVSDVAALSFSQGFYRALGAGKSYEQAYRFGCNQVAIDRLKESHIPRIISGKLRHFEEELTAIQRRFLKAQSIQELGSIQAQIDALLAKQPSFGEGQRLQNSVHKAFSFVRTPRGVMNLAIATGSIPVITIAVWGIVGCLTPTDALGTQLDIAQLLFGAIAGSIVGLSSIVLGELASQQICPRGTYQQALTRGFSEVFMRINEILYWSLGGAVSWWLICSSLLIPIRNDFPNSEPMPQLAVSLLGGSIAAFISLCRLSLKF